MPGKLLRNGAIVFASALLMVGCSTSQPAPVNRDGLRAVVGTSLIGARGATPRDQGKIDETAAGLCAASVWSRSECARHGRESRP